MSEKKKNRYSLIRRTVHNCTNCGECQSACSRDAIRFGRPEAVKLIKK